MKVPDSITLFGFEISTERDLTLLADRARYGEYCSRTMKITQDGNLSNQRSLLNYFHETVEAICDINGLDMGEKEKQAIALGIYQILQQADKFKEENRG